MPRPPSQAALARRALIDDRTAAPRALRRGLLVTGVVLGIGLGLGVAGSYLSPPSAGHAAPLAPVRAALVAPAALSRPAPNPVPSTSSSAPATAARAANRHVTGHSRVRPRTQPPAARSARPASRAPQRFSLPITSGYRLAARFGATGRWSRYHTGVDFAAGVGTPVRAITAGVVAHAGYGSARWAGRYVTIRHADGRSTLYAHLSTVSVHPGDRVRGGERIGAVGMTGRTFGPHVHVELYPAGVRPGRIYSAINPAPWMRAHRLHV